MSSYKRLTQHPETHEAEHAEWLDDYFGNHNYGVRFPSDGQVFRADEYEWNENPQTMVLESSNPKGILTIEQTEKGSRWGEETQERKDVTVKVNRLDLKDPTPEDEKAGAAVSERLAKVAVRVVVIHKPTNDFASFECKLPEVRSGAMQVVKKYNEALAEKLGVKGAEAPLSEFVLVEYESHQVRVTSLI